MSDILEKIKNENCPFSGKPYDCCKCELTTEQMPRTINQNGYTTLHCCLSITRFVEGNTTKRELKNLANSFTKDDDKSPTVKEMMEYFRQLYKLGVEVIPLCECERFCFKHGCRK